MSSPEVWCEIATSNEDPPVLASALGQAPLTHVLARAGQLESLRLNGGLKLAALAGPDELEQAAAMADIVVVREPGLVARARQTGRPVGLWREVFDADSLQTCCQNIGRVDYMIVGLRDETNIPLELLLARGQGKPTRLIKAVSGHDDAAVALGVLERGPAGVMFSAGSLREVKKLAKVLWKAQDIQLRMVEAEVTSVSHAGAGYRGCIDTTWMLGADEGMLVGSTSRGGLLVCAEVHPMPYMNLRPFRVNAGAIHSYVWGPGMTHYVTDLGAGANVLRVSTAGVARAVTVGRVKIEVRPLLLVSAVAEGQALNVFLQDDWHVRVFDARGMPCNSSDLRQGDRLLAHLSSPARHVGMPVDETIEER
jgi:3-dehydroquinate synthase II/3-amino-4-hydroxybenzoic acid synthase